MSNFSNLISAIKINSSYEVRNFEKTEISATLTHYRSGEDCYLVVSNKDNSFTLLDIRWESAVIILETHSFNAIINELEVR